ncbi:MAG TPA: alpha/beta hydrolase, partial [Ruminococcaceae bacterium]|nr:alpha/beta hydrolase [Oscillospiraceae bacterium]
MKIDTYSFTLPSELKGTEIVGKVYTPMVRANAKAVFQIAHGMAEHIERYDEFCAFLASNGYAVYIHDHVGHGKSVKEDTELGFFGLEKGWRTLIDDCLSVNRLAASEFPGKPMIFFGHSMGSFVARAYTMLHSGNLSGAIYCGTSGANPAAGIAIWLADAVAHSKGSHYHSDFINTLAFGAYNKKIKP